MGKMSLGLFSLWIICISLFGLSAFAAGGNMATHQLSFDTIRDSSDGKHEEAEILDYQYGSSGQFATFANKEMVSLGKTFRQESISGFMQRGEFLYVKWRILGTEDVFEDRVDFRPRLPDKIENLNLHFVVRGPQLFIFVIYPWDGKPWERESRRTEFLPIPGGTKRYQGHKYVQIYPEPPAPQ